MRKNTPFLIKFTLFFLVCMSQTPIQAQLVVCGVDEVITFLPGVGQNSGQSSEYFPRNIFGMPDSAARTDVPSTSPEEICSLGMGGEITLHFRGKVLIDAPGKDFIVFENAFYSADFGKTFIEPARVSVSQDGINFVAFPFDSLSFKGCAGISPTNGNAFSANPVESGGDSFDLADIGIDSVRFIRITDISAMLLNRKHPLYDPITTGFDLDAVVGLHVANEEATPISVMFSQKSAIINSNKDIEIACYSLSGTLLQKTTINSRTGSRYSLDELPPGVFALYIRTLDNSHYATFPFILCP